MYHPVPLNWMAGAESSFCTSAPQVGQAESAASENFWITSKRPQLAHWYSYKGTRTPPPKQAILPEPRAAFQRQRPFGPP
jgi:hypothetical protein